MNLESTFKAPAIGTRAPEFGELAGADGKRYSRASFQESEILVLVFSSNGCPTVRAFEERMAGIQEEYGPRGVQLVSINSNNPYLSPGDSLVEMVRRAREKQFNFPYLKDERGNVARAHGATCTPHAFVLDKERLIRYRGRIDDSRMVAAVKSPDLRNALDDLLTGAVVRQTETEPFGCAIVW